MNSGSAHFRTLVDAPGPVLPDDRAQTDRLTITGSAVLRALEPEAVEPWQ